MQNIEKSGFARILNNVSATVINTSSDGLDVGLSSLASATPIYFARPKFRAALPVILIAQEIFGLHEHIRDIARRFARLGYLAIAPDYLIRYGDPSDAQDLEAIREIVSKVPDTEVLSIFDEAVAHATKLRGDANHVGIVGFCWGGRLSWLYAAHNRQLKACVPWYGRLDGLRTTEHPLWPVDIGTDLHVPSLGLYGGADSSIPADVIVAFQEQLSKAKAPGLIVVFEGAPHGFNADYRDTYCAENAQDAWARMCEFLQAQGLRVSI